MALLEDGTTNGSQAPTTDVAAMEAELALARDRVTDSVRALGAEIARRRDWRSWVRARPTLFLAVAAGVGFLSGRAIWSSGKADRAPAARRTRKR